MFKSIIVPLLLLTARAQQQDVIIGEEGYVDLARPKEGADCTSTGWECDRTPKECKNGEIVYRNKTLDCMYDLCEDELPACTKELMECKSGEAVSRNPLRGCAFDPCPLMDVEDIELCDRPESFDHIDPNCCSCFAESGRDLTKDYCIVYFVFITSFENYDRLFTNCSEVVNVVKDIVIEQQNLCRGGECKNHTDPDRCNRLVESCTDSTLDSDLDRCHKLFEDCMKDEKRPPAPPLPPRRSLPPPPPPTPEYDCDYCNIPCKCENVNVTSCEKCTEFEKLCSRCNTLLDFGGTTSDAKIMSIGLLSVASLIW